jgi:hypothetical protein
VNCDAVLARRMAPSGLGTGVCHQGDVYPVGSVRTPAFPLLPLQNLGSRAELPLAPHDFRHRAQAELLPAHYCISG